MTTTSETPETSGPWRPSPPDASLDVAVFQAIGTGSVCWTDVDGERVFDADRARWVADGLLSIISDALAEPTATDETKDARGNDVVHVFKGTTGDWHWQRKAANGQIIAIGGEGYTERNDAVEIATAVNPGVTVDADPWR